MKKKIFVTIFIAFVLSIGIELYLRFYWGFCDTVLSQKDTQYEYIAQPNQDRVRFKHHIYYNKYSMRSQEIRQATFKILGFGDSVINGGAFTDQDSLATTIIDNLLINVN